MRRTELKPGKPLQRRTPMLQRKTPLVASSSLSRSPVKGREVALRQRSKKRASEESRYRSRVGVWLAGKRCRLHADEGILHAAEECHHAKGRIGALLLDERFWVPLCHSAHQYVTEHPIEAEQRGYSVSRLAKESAA